MFTWKIDKIEIKDPKELLNEFLDILVFREWAQQRYGNQYLSAMEARCEILENGGEE